MNRLEVITTQSSILDVQGSGAVKKGQTIRNLKLLQYLPIYV